MTPYEPLLAQVTSRYGLTSRHNWHQEVTKAARLLAERFDCEPTDLVERASRDPRVLDVLVGHLTVGESYFFRHELHFQLLAERLREQSDTIRQRGGQVLSLGSSTGEEAYSIAITARESLGARLADRLEILGVDVDQSAVEKAGEGIYSSWSFRGASPRLQERYFLESGDDRWRVDERIRSAVRFEVASIHDRLVTLPTGKIDAVFFRNVGIYLTAAAVAEIYEEIRRVLRQKGLLFVAPADPRPNSGWSRVDHESASIYRKGSTDGPKHAKRPRPAPPHRRPRKRRVLPSRKIEAATPRPSVREATHRSRGELLRNLLACGDRGEMERALILADELVAASPSCPSGYLLRGKVQIAAGRELEALSDLRRVTFLDPEQIVGRYWYAVALAHANQASRSAQQLEVLSKQLDEQSDSTELEDGEVTAGELRRAVAELQESLR